MRSSAASVVIWIVSPFTAHQLRPSGSSTPSSESCQGRSLAEQATGDDGPSSASASAPQSTSTVSPLNSCQLRTTSSNRVHGKKVNVTCSLNFVDRRWYGDSTDNMAAG